MEKKHLKRLLLKAKFKGISKDVFPKVIFVSENIKFKVNANGKIKAYKIGDAHNSLQFRDSKLVKYIFSKINPLIKIKYNKYLL